MAETTYGPWVDADRRVLRQQNETVRVQEMNASYANALEAQAQVAETDRKLAEWARQSLATKKKLQETYCTPKPGEDPTEVKWRFGSTANGYELYKGPYLEEPGDPDAEGIVEIAFLHARGLPDLADRLNALEAKAQAAEGLLAALVTPCSHSWRSIAMPSIERASNVVPRWCSLCGALASVGAVHVPVRVLEAQAHAAGVTA